MNTARSPFDLAVCAEMIYTNEPIGARLRKIRDHGFAAEIWTAQNHDLDELTDAVADGVRIVSMSGYLEGRLADEVGATQLHETAKRCIDVAHRLGVTRLNLHGTGLGPDGLPTQPTAVTTPAMWARAALTLRSMAELATENEVIFELENLNTRVDHPGTPFARAADVLDLVEAVDHPGLRMNLDLYHAQIGEGDLCDLVRRTLPVIGQIQVADVPGRCEPGTGEIHYPAVARVLEKLGYRGIVAMEAFARTNPESALIAFREAFSPS